MLPYNIIQITPSGDVVTVRIRHWNGTESFDTFATDAEANSFVCGQPFDYYVLDERHDPVVKLYVRDFRKL